MIITFSFDKQSRDWNENYELNLIFTRSMLHYLQDLYIAQGYLYLDEIYKAFGCVWNPYQDNKCWILERDGALRCLYSNDQTSKKIDITIRRDYKTYERIHEEILERLSR